MKVLIIGGAGYIGSHVTLACLEKGYSVTVYDNLSTGCRENLFDECKFYEADILDIDTLKKVMNRGFDVIIHLAAFKAAGESMVKPEKYSKNNIAGTLNIINTASVTGIKNIVFSSSAAIYGTPQYLPLDEKHPAEPANYYGFTKLVIEGLLRWYDSLRSIKYAALRYFNTAGYDPDGRIKGLEKNPANLFPVIMEVAAGVREKLEIFGDDYPTDDGTCIRDYIHVTDLADAHIESLEYIVEKKESIVVNLGSEKGKSVIDVLTAAREITGRTIPSKIVGRRPGDPAILYASSGKAKQILGWEAKKSDLHSLIMSTWKIYERNFIYK